MKALVVGLIALTALAAPTSAGAFFNNTDVDVDAIPRLPCKERPLPTEDVWCGKWETDQPVGPLATFESLGAITLDSISIPQAQAVEGKPFGAFNYTSKCSADAHNYAGSYRGSGSTAGEAGRILACADGTTLHGTYRTSELENAGNTFPGSGFRSGEFTITHNLRGAAAAFTGTILQHFSATVPWTGRCTVPTCQAELPPQPPIVGPPLFRIRGFSSSPEIRSAADGVTRRMEVGWLVGAGDRLTAAGSLRINGRAFILLEAVAGGARFEVKGTAVQDARGNSIATPAVFEAEETPILRQGEATVTTAGAQTRARSAAIQGAELLTPVSRVSMSGGVATVTHDPRRRLTTVGNVRGSASVTPVNRALRGLKLVPGRGVEVTRNSISAPFALVPGGSGTPDLRTFIPSPREVRAGPAIATAPSRLSLRSLRGSKCVRVGVTSARPARVLVTIFSGKRSVRLFGQRLVIFTAAGRTSTCIPVPARARTFDVRTPLRFAVGYALGARARSGERPTRPVVRPIALVP